MAYYIAFLHKDRHSDYGVSFPDFPGCVTAGETIEEAQRMAEEALAGHIEVMMEAGEEIPGPSSLDAARKRPQSRDALCFLVRAPEARDPAVRVNVTIPESILARFDRFAEARGLTRSGALAKAMLGWMGAHKAQRDEAVARASEATLPELDPRDIRERAKAQRGSRGSFAPEDVRQRKQPAGRRRRSA